jgi:Rod binding domain-containing protein
MKEIGQTKVKTFPLCVDCLPRSSDRQKVIDDVCSEFESFFIKEFLKNAFVMSGELAQNYGYFYKEIVLDTLSRTSSVGIKDFLKKAIENNLEFIQNGYIKKKSSIGRF